MKYLTSLVALMLCIQLQSAELTKESLLNAIIEMKTVVSDNNLKSAKTFIEKYVNPEDIKKAIDGGKTINELASMVFDSGKYAKMAVMLNAADVTNGIVDNEASEIACKYSIDGSEGWIRFLLIDKKWYIKN